MNAATPRATPRRDSLSRPSELRKRLKALADEFGLAAVKREAAKLTDAPLTRGRPKLRSPIEPWTVWVEVEVKRCLSRPASVLSLCRAICKDGGLRWWQDGPEGRAVERAIASPETLRRIYLSANREVQADEEGAAGLRKYVAVRVDAIRKIEAMNTVSAAAD